MFRVLAGHLACGTWASGSFFVALYASISQIRMYEGVGSGSLCFIGLGRRNLHSVLRRSQGQARNDNRDKSSNSSQEVTQAL